MEEERDNILEIRGAYKSYSSTEVILRGLDMTVARGTIYGLLGPSGCGKTTLLSCVAGFLVLDCGSIRVDLKKKSELGFMPQDIALQELCTVSEMLTYFGKVNGLSSSIVETKGRELLHLMELPPDIYWNRVIATLSGGQQRRISLAVTILHDPVLMILDEPTVGLDPLLSQKLWEYFAEMTEQYGKTIIITTHYIEESRRAHMIGMMRSGVLLAEAPPSQLLRQYNCDALEDVFLLLSTKQNIVCIENDEVYPYFKRKSTDTPLGDSKLWDKNRMKAEIYRNTCHARRNIPMMMFMMVLPAIIIFIFCIMCADTLNSVVISVISEEVLPDFCLHPIDPSQNLPLCNHQSRLSCRYLKYIEDRNYIVEEHTDVDSAYQSVKSGHAHAMLHFDRNYSKAFVWRLSDTLDTPDRYVNASIIKVHMDRSDITTAYTIEEDLREGIRKLARSVAVDCGFNSRITEQIVHIETPIFGELNGKFTKGALPGLIIPFVFYVTSFLSATTLSSEKASGFLNRCFIAGIRQTELIFGKSIVQIFLVTGQNLLLVTLAYGIFDMPLKGSWLLTITFLGIAEIQGMTYGFLLATLIETEKNVSYTSTGTVLFLFLSCGLLWPLEGAHWIIQKAFYYFPIVMAVESYRSVTVRGWGIMNGYVTLSLVSNIILLLFMISIFILVSRTKK